MELLQLSEYTRQASLGGDYTELKIIYPEWSSDLHKYGHYLDNDKLEIIALEGIIRWYLKEYTPFDIDYNYFDILYFVENPEQISYSDLYYIQQMGKLNNVKCFMANLIEKCKYNFITKNKIDNIYCSHKFGKYLCDVYGKPIVSNYIKNIYTSIRNRRQYFLTHNSFYDYFLYKYPQIKKWGVIYQKYKIILEQITKNNHNDIYKVDSFVENIQCYIYTLIMKYIENFIISDNNDIVLTNEDKFNNDKYLQYYKDLNNFI